MIASTTRGEPSAGGRRPVVVVLSEHALMADAVAAALRSRGIDAYPGPWSGYGIAVGRPGSAPDAGILLVAGDRVDLRGAARALPAAGRTVPWVVLVERPTAPLRLGVLAATTTLVLPQSASLAETVAAVRLVAAAGRAADAAVAVAVDPLPEPADRTSDEHLVQAVRALTPSERGVLEMLYSGMSVTQVAHARTIAVATVRHHVRCILRKLGVSSQLAAVACYARVLDRTGSRGPRED